MIKTHTATRVKPLPVALALALAMPGSAVVANAAGKEAPQRTTEARQDVPISPRWIGYAIGLRQPRVERLGTPTIIRRTPGTDAGFAIPDTAGAGPIDSSQSPGHSSTAGASVLRLVNYRTREQYRITIDAGDLPRFAPPSRRASRHPALATLFPRATVWLRGQAPLFIPSSVEIRGSASRRRPCSHTARSSTSPMNVRVRSSRTTSS